MGRAHRQGTRADHAQVVRPDDGQSGRPGAHPDRRNGQALCRGQGRDRLRRLLYRMVRRRGKAGLRRNHSRPHARQAPDGDQAARGRCRLGHAMELPQCDDRAQGRPGHCRRLRLCRAPRRRNPAVGAGDGRAGRPGRPAQGDPFCHHFQTRLRHRQGILRESDRAETDLHRVHRGGPHPAEAGRRSGDEMLDGTGRQRPLHRL